MKVSSQNVKAIMLGFLAMIGYTAGDSILKGVMPHYNTFFAGLIVVIFQCFIILSVLPFMGGVKTAFKANNLKVNIIRGAFAAFSWIIFIVGLQFNDLAVNYSVHLSASLWVAIFSVFIFKMNLGMPRWIAIIVGFIGVLVVMRPGTESFQLTTIIPVFSAICFASMALATRLIGESEKQSTLLVYITFSNLFYLTIIITALNTWQTVTLEHAVYFLLSACCYLGGILASNKAFTIGDTSAVNPTQYSQIIWGALIGYFFFAEMPTLWTILGASLIVLSGIYMIYREHKVSKNGATD